MKKVEEVPENDNNRSDIALHILKYQRTTKPVRGNSFQNKTKIYSKEIICWAES